MANMISYWNCFLCFFVFGIFFLLISIILHQQRLSRENFDHGVADALFCNCSFLLVNDNVSKYDFADVVWCYRKSVCESSYTLWAYQKIAILITVRKMCVIEIGKVYIVPHVYHLTFFCTNVFTSTKSKMSE